MGLANPDANRPAHTLPDGEDNDRQRVGEAEGGEATIEAVAVYLVGVGVGVGVRGWG